MVQNDFRTGRPLGFDRDRVIALAMELFWTEGYERVGVADLEKCTGLNRSSLYNTLGGKDGIFCLALRRYSDEVAGQMLEALVQGERGLDDVQDFVDGVARYLSAFNGRGCFMVNTMASGVDQTSEVADCVRRHIERMLNAIRAALGRAVELGEFPAHRVEASAHMLLGVMLGANLLARGRQPPEQIREVLNGAMAHLREAR
jgi:TetR/AcrR family transcriptional repressor of nem operon